MNPASMKTIFCLHIPEPSRRGQVARLLTPVAHKLFTGTWEAVMDTAKRDGLVERLRKILDPVYDRMVIFTACAACERRIIALGAEEGRERPGRETAIVL